MTGLELRQKREDWGLTQVRFAALLFVGHTTISMWETGMRKISPRYQRAINHLFDELEKNEAIQQMILDWDSRIEDALNAPQLKNLVLSAETIPSMKNVDRILRELERILSRANS